MASGCRQSQYLELQNTTAPSSCNKLFIPEFESVLYNSHINVIGKHLSGLLLFKAMPDSSTRVVFSNEMGVKFFDFEFKANDFHVIYCIKQLNKKSVINQLEKDIGLLIFHRTDTSQLQISRLNEELYFGFKSGK
ncbi:MAG: hypothetical protein IPP71_18695 [Bacteroidetes bacterium]|nr:hypothetical protein [Bacteroidota bacterium]